MGFWQWLLGRVVSTDRVLALLTAGDASEPSAGTLESARRLLLTHANRLHPTITCFVLSGSSLYAPPPKVYR